MSSRKARKIAQKNKVLQVNATWNEYYMAPACFELGKLMTILFV